ncbi:glycosyltransferase family A protein [Nocardia sp. NPDC003183]
MTIAVLTAVHAGYARYLGTAWNSLHAQTRTDWVWTLQVDGPRSPDVLAALSTCDALGDVRVRLAFNGTREGPATTRNIALGRIEEPLVQNLDADDALEPDALAALSDALTHHPRAGFAVGIASDVHDSGATVEVPIGFCPGVLPRGALVDEWITNDTQYHVPVHPAGAMWRREVLLAVGGWAALRNMEDTALLMASSAVADGVAVGIPTLRYRRHRLQRSRQTSIFEGGGGSKFRWYARVPNFSDVVRSGGSGRKTQPASLLTEITVRTRPQPSGSAPPQHGNVCI